MQIQYWIIAVTVLFLLQCIYMCVFIVTPKKEVLTVLKLYNRMGSTIEMMLDFRRTY